MRGSTPCCGEEIRRYGGNTSCVSLGADGEPPIVFDLGTGLRYFGAGQPHDGSFAGTALVTHLHWDHVQGLPFCVPILVPGSRYDVYAPAPAHGTVAEAFDGFMCDPYFPVSVRDLPGTIEFHATPESRFRIGEASVLARPVPHIGTTVGYRVEWHGTSIAYISDHQQPLDGSYRVDPRVLELADGVDLLIHDAQYTPSEFARKSHWGHCTIEYACHVAKEAGAFSLALFHHDPGRTDDALDDVVRCAAEVGERTGVRIFAAAEGQRVVLDNLRTA